MAGSRALLEGNERDLICPAENFVHEERQVGELIVVDMDKYGAIFGE